MSYRIAVKLYFFINGFVMANWAARIPQIQEDYDIQYGELSLVLLAHSIGAFISMPLTGWFIGKSSSRLVTTIAGFVFPVCYILIPQMPSYYFLFLPYLFMGVGNGVVDVAMNAQAVEVEKYLAKPIMGSFHALFSVGTLVGAATGAWFTAQLIPLDTHFLITGLLGLVVLIGACRFLYPDNSKIEKGEQWFVLPKGVFIGLGIIAFCTMMGEGAMSDWSTNYMKQIVGSPPSTQTFGFIAFTALMTVGRFAGDSARARYGDKRTMLIGSLMALIGMVFILLLISEALIILGFGLVGLGLANIVPIVYSLAGNMPGVKPSVGIAMATTVGYTGFMFGPTIIGFISDATSLWGGLFVLGVLFVLMAAMVLRYTAKPSN